MGGGSDLTLAAPFPDDPLDPLDPVDPVDPDANSKKAIFIVRVVIFGLDGAPALCFFDFFKDVLNGLLGLRPHRAPKGAKRVEKEQKTMYCRVFSLKSSIFVVLSSFSAGPGPA